MGSERGGSNGVMREPATGLAPAPLHRGELPQTTIWEILGTVDQRIEFSEAHGYEVDTVLAASAEFRRTVGGSPFKWMVRGEAIHIARALAALCGLDLTDAATTEAGDL